MGYSDNVALLSEVILDSEPVARNIYYHPHVKSNGKLKWQAFDPTPGTDEVSVVRSACMSPSECKKRAKLIAVPPNKVYKGLAILRSEEIRNLGLQVTDSREEYYGHAHISIGVKTQKRPPDVPRDPREVEHVKTVAGEILKITKYHPDPDIESEEWQEGQWA